MAQESPPCFASSPGWYARQQGQIELEGGEPELTLAEQVHYLGHQDALKPSLSVSENLAFWVDFLGGGTADKALAMVGLDRLADLPTLYLSAGQRRRLSLARLAAVERRIWLLDEPTSALDASAQTMLTDLMRSHLAAGGLIIAAAHGPIGLEAAKDLRLGEPMNAPHARAPSPAAGEGWGGGTHARICCMPPPCPSPAAGR